MGTPVSGLVKNPVPGPAEGGARQEVLRARTGVLSPQTGQGVPSSQDGGNNPPPPPSTGEQVMLRRGCMPLAVMQGDFLVINFLKTLWRMMPKMLKHYALGKIFE